MSESFQNIEEICKKYEGTKTAAIVVHKDDSDVNKLQILGIIEESSGSLAAYCLNKYGNLAILNAQEEVYTDLTPLAHMIAVLEKHEKSENSPTTPDTPKTGKRYNDGKLRWHNFPLFLFEPVIQAAELGEEKYGAFNYLKGLPLNATLNSLKRHLVDFENPYKPDVDAESQCSHLAHVAWNALVALHHLNTRQDLDDRYKIDKPTKKED